MLKALIVENDIDFLETFSKELQSLFPHDLQIVALCNTPIEGLKAIAKFKPDLVFLDIDMPEMNGLELLEIASKTHRFQVIFVTAYNEYAVRAFQLSAVHYLLKPVIPEHLAEAMRRAKERHVSTADGDSVQMLLENYHLPPFEQKIAIPGADGYDFVFIKDIVYCAADGNFTKVYVSGMPKFIMTARLLGFFEKLLPKEKFFRIHSGYIVNLSFLKKYVRGDGGYVIMSDGANLSVSRRCKDDFLKWAGL